MLDLSRVDDFMVSAHLESALGSSAPGSAEARILRAALECSKRFSFSNTRTYPRPDHPDPEKRRSLFFLFCAIIVSLRTTLENEQAAMVALMAEARTDEELLNLSTREIASLIRVAGMAETKAIRIKEGLIQLSEYPGGPEGLSKLSKEGARNFLLAIPGVGPKAADCLLTIGLGIPSMVVDVNVFRSANWILDGKTEGLDYSKSIEVKIMKDRLDSMLSRHDAFLYQIVHTELLLLSKGMGRAGHTTTRCIGAKFCKACAKEVPDEASTMF